MDLINGNDAVARRVAAMVDRVGGMKENDEYYYNMPVEELRGGSKVLVEGREMGMYASYSYLGLVEFLLVLNKFGPRNKTFQTYGKKRSQVSYNLSKK